MSLESGKYTITSKLGDAPVGRRLAEPRDTSPKGIFKLPQNTAAHPTIWEVEKLENGNYKFKANNSIVGVIDELVFAILFKDQIPNATTIEWTLRRDEWDTERKAYVYILRCLHSLVPNSLAIPRVLAAGGAEPEVGWTAPEGEDEQILIQGVASGRSLPPTYFPKNVFFFKKLD